MQRFAGSLNFFPVAGSTPGMEILTSSNDLGTLGLGLLIAGAAAGLVSGILGRGAGLILVPALYLVAGEAGVRPDLAMHLAVGTSFACLVPLALARMTTFNPDATARRLMLPAFAGLFAGAAGLTLFLPLSGTNLVFVFATGALAAVALTIAIDAPRPGAGADGFAAALAAFAGTFLAGLTGLSGTALTMPALMALGAPRQEAMATAAGYAIPITVAGASVAVAAGWGAPGLPPYSCGFVNLIAFAIVAPVAFAANRVAARHADILDAKKLRLLFALFVAASTAKMVWTVVG